MNEHQFGARARSVLNQGLSLHQGHLERLKAAREQALSKQRQRALAAEFLPAWAARALGPFGPLGGSGRALMPLLLVVLVAMGVQFWLQSQGRDDPLAEIESAAQIDSALLKGDLPIDAYLDSGFQSWLKRSSSSD